MIDYNRSPVGKLIRNMRHLHGSTLFALSTGIFIINDNNKNKPDAHSNKKWTSPKKKEEKSIMH